MFNKTREVSPWVIRFQSLFLSLAALTQDYAILSFWDAHSWVCILHFCYLQEFLNEAWLREFDIAFAVCDVDAQHHYNLHVCIIAINSLKTCWP